MLDYNNSPSVAFGECPDVSVIVPIYNVEKWLAACLDSLLNQSLENWEAILIDDESKDSSFEIALAYAEKDSRFKIVRQKNTGLGGARNTGCKHAKGRFLFFLDSDDMISRDTLKGMVKAADDNSVDLVVGDFYTFTDGEEVIDTNKDYPAPDHFNKTFSAYPAVFNWQVLRDNIDVLYLGNYFCVACAKLFRRDLWERIGCESPGNLRMAEDFVAVKRFTFSSNKITTYPRAALLYRKRPGSATTQRNTKTFEIFRAYEYALMMFKDVGVFEQEYNNIHRFFLHSFNAHMLWFTPYRDWWRFYKQAAKIIADWDESRLDKNIREKVLACRHSPYLQFVKIVFDYVGVRSVKEKVKRWLPLETIAAIRFKLGLLKK